MTNEHIYSTTNNNATVRAMLISRVQSGNAPSGPVHPYYQPWSTSSSAGSSTTKGRAPITTVSATSAPPACPMHKGESSSSGSTTSTSMSGNGGGSEKAFASMSARLNPLNNMPTLSQERAEKQKTHLSTDRTMSTIPRLTDSPAPGAHPYDKASATASACPVPHDQRGNSNSSKNGSQSVDSAAGHWEYPSPQQFYNALVRKGWETPEEHVEMMVMVHNFLNERAWLEVLEWEREMGIESKDVALARFQGRPGTISPKARFFSWAAMVMPNTFSSEPPFDRHDWVVRRPAVGGTDSETKGKEVRYVIDYYSEPDDPTTEEPVFVLDVRPALDSFEAAQARMRRTWNEWRNQQDKSN